MADITPIGSYAGEFTVIQSGDTVNPTALGTGTPNSTTFLRGDKTWASIGNGTVTSVGGTGTVNGLTLTGAVTTSGNLTLGGTLSGIGNAALTNSSVTIGSTAVSLGATVTTFAGLTSVTSTTFVGALTGNASSATTVTTNANLTGPITSVGNATSVTANAITNAMLAQIPTANFHGRVTAATGNVENLTGTQATTLLDVFTTSLKGLAPASGGGTTNFLRADGTWTTPGGGTVTSVSVVTANGVSGSVATATSTPAITLTLGAITPTSVAATGALSGTTLTVGSGTTTSDVIIAGAMNRDRAGALTTAAVTLVNLDTWAAATYRSAKYIIQAVNTVTGNVYFTEVMMIKNNANDVYITEYATVTSGTNIIALSADYDGSTNVRLRVTPASANSTQIKFRATIFNI